MPDTFQEIIKSDVAPISGAGSISGSGAPTGTYFAVANDLSEGDAPTMRTNLGLGSFAVLDNDGTADLDVSTLTASGLIRGGSLRTDDGKIHAPVELQIRNAGDTGFRGLTVASLDIGTTEHGFDSSGNVSGAEGVFNNNSFNPLKVERSGTSGRGISFTRSGDRVADVIGQGTGGFNFRVWNIDGDNSFYDTSVSNVGVWDFPDDIQINSTTVIDSSRNFFGSDGDFSGNVDILGTTTTDILDVANTSTFGGVATFEDNVFVEKGLFVNEFVVNTTKVLTDFAMSAGGKVGSVSGISGNEIVTFVDENNTVVEPFGVDDIIHIQVATGATSGTIVKNIYRYVVSIDGSSNYQLGDEADDPGFNWEAEFDDVGTIAVGDSAVRKGNTAGNTDRDHYIKFDISGNGGVEAPTVTVFDNVTNVNDDGDIRLMYGKLDGKYGIGASAEEFGFAVGDSSLVGNHIVLTPSTTAFQLDTFNLESDGFSVKDDTGIVINVEDSFTDLRSLRFNSDTNEVLKIQGIDNSAVPLLGAEFTSDGYIGLFGAEGTNLDEAGLKLGGGTARLDIYSDPTDGDRSYFNFTRSGIETIYIIIDELPISATGLPSGCLWRDGSTIKIA